MWAKIRLLEYLEYLQTLKFRLASKDFNDNANFMFILICFIFVFYLIFYKFLKRLLIKSNVSRIKHRQSINFIWNFIYYFCCTTFLILYHSYFIKEELDLEKGKWYPKRKNLLFYKPCDMVKFKIISCIIAGFNITSAVFDFLVRDLSDAASKILFTCLVITCYIFGYENYSVVLNINLGLFHMFTELLSLLALHTEKDQIAMFRVFVVFKFISWIYIFLNFLPFQYMMPTIHAKDINIALNIFFILWYISKIWSSPLLNVLQHQLYHVTAFDCQGESSLTRCIMLKDSPELKHQKNLKRAVMQVKLHHQRHQLNKLNLSEQAACSTAFQTIKCVMTLKRKLKRIRSHHQQEHQQQHEQAKSE